MKQSLVKTHPEISISIQHPDHAEGLFAALSNPRIYLFLDERPPVSVDVVREDIERRLRGAPVETGQIWLNWCVFHRNKVVGYTQATVFPDHCADIAYVMSTEVWGTGVAITAVQLTISELANQYGVTRLVADTEKRNAASRNLLDRLGFVETHRTGRDIHFACVI